MDISIPIDNGFIEAIGCYRSPAYDILDKECSSLREKSLHILVFLHCLYSVAYMVEVVSSDIDTIRGNILKNPLQKSRYIRKYVMCCSHE